MVILWVSWCKNKWFCYTWIVCFSLVCTHFSLRKFKQKPILTASHKNIIKTSLSKVDPNWLLFERCTKLKSFEKTMLFNNVQCAAIKNQSYKNTKMKISNIYSLLWTDLVKMLTRKSRHASPFYFECTDFKNVIIEKIHWVLSEDDLEIQTDKNSK